MNKEKNKKIILEIIAILLGGIVTFLPTPLGLEKEAMLVLGLLVWAIINWITKVIPDFIVVIIMCCGWTIFGIVPFERAFSSFSNTTVWLLIAAMLIGMAVTKSGLLSRGALLTMKICPTSFKGQAFALLFSGIFIGPVIPSSTAKVSIVGSMATDIGERLGYKDKSKGMAGLWAAMYTGYTLLAPICLSSSFFGYIIYNLMPADVKIQFSFGYWILAMLPWGIITAMISFVAICICYEPKNDKKIKNEQFKKIGKLSKEEKITIVVLLCCIMLWMLEQKINISSAITALIGMAILLSLNVIDVDDFNNIPWNIIVFIGGAINLATVISEVNLDTWISNSLSVFFEMIAGNIYIFLPMVSIVVLLVRFLIVDMTTCFTLFILILTPICISRNINPWIIGITSYIVVMPWFVKYQNFNFCVAYEAAGGEKKIKYKDLIPYCVIFHVISIIALVLSIPYWKFIGLIG